MIILNKHLGPKWRAVMLPLFVEQDLWLVKGSDVVIHKSGTIIGITVKTSELNSQLLLGYCYINIMYKLE